MKVHGIEGKRHVSWRDENEETVRRCLNKGSINDIGIAINKWLGENQDAAIVDIKIIPREIHYDALILYETYISKHGKSTKVKWNPTLGKYEAEEK